MKIWVASDEWWPVYIFEDGYGRQVDVDEDTLKRWRDAFEVFSRVQSEMEEAYKSA